MAAVACHVASAACMFTEQHVLKSVLCQAQFLSSFLNRLSIPHVVVS